MRGERVKRKRDSDKERMKNNKCWCSTLLPSNSTILCEINTLTTSTCGLSYLGFILSSLSLICL